MIAIDLPLKPSGKSINPLANENLKFVPKKHIQASRHWNFIRLERSNKALIILLLLLLLLLLFIALASSAHRYWFVHKIAYRPHIEMLFIILKFDLCVQWTLNSCRIGWIGIDHIWHASNMIRFVDCRSSKAQAAQFTSVNKETSEEGGYSGRVREHSQPNIYPFVCYTSPCLSKRSTLICR